MKILVNNDQLDQILDTGILRLKPAYVDNGNIYYTHVCPDDVAGVIELSCPETVIVHKDELLQVGPWVVAAHIFATDERTTTNAPITYVYPNAMQTPLGDAELMLKYLHRAVFRPRLREVAAHENFSQESEDVAEHEIGVRNHVLFLIQEGSDVPRHLIRLNRETVCGQKIHNWMKAVGQDFDSVGGFLTTKWEIA